MSNHTKHAFYNNVGSSTSPSSTLPNQAVTEAIKRTEKWQHRVMDALESIGISQLAENVHFRDYRKMLTGNLVYSDYGIEDQSILNQIRELGDNVGIPTFVKHYDFIGIIIRQFIGEWLNQKDNFKVDSIDETSDNEFLRELNIQAEDFVLSEFERELQIKLLKKGIDPAKSNFQSDEERQQYLQMLEQEKAKAIPVEERIKTTSKNFKTKAAEWAEHTLEHDQSNYNMSELDAEEIEDYLLTGRYFRHYHVGYDYYKPERWLPEETFFSKDVNIKHPQDGEYAGRVFFLGASDIIQRYGASLTPKDIKTLQKRFGDTTNFGQDSRKPFSTNNMTNTFFGDDVVLPFAGYVEYDLGLQIQDALNVPMGETFIDTPEGQQAVPSWLSPFQNQNYVSNSYASMRREDISVRTDLMQVTEAYWRSWKRMWLLNYTTKTGYSATEIVTDDLSPEFIEEYNIKKSSKYALNNIEENMEENTMYEFWIPEVWRGVKINAGNSLLGDNIYLDVEPLPYQVKGDSDTFEVLLPVTGIISDSVAHRLRPFQVGYNICMNQIWNLLEKEIGMFFLFDINYLPSEYKDYGDIEESLMKLRDFAKDVGIVPMDTSKQGMQGNVPQMNTLMTQDISFDKQINSRVSLATFYYQKALEQIGITPARLGQATTFETATGVQQGVTASHDQTAQIFQKMSTARKKSTNMHLAIAQYCQKEFIDKDFVFRSSDNDKTFINLTDPDFPLRRLNVFAINDPKKRRDLEMMKQTLLQMNTLGDMQDYAELYSADTIVELVSMGRRSRQEAQQREQEGRQHEQEMLDKQLQAQAQDKESQRQFEKYKEDKRNETDIRVASINANAKLLDKNNTSEDVSQVQDYSTQILNDFKQQEIGVKKDLAENKKQIEQGKLQRLDEQLKLKTRELDIKEKQEETKRFVAVVNPS